jgi:hypothetical protein
VENRTREKCGKIARLTPFDIRHGGRCRSAALSFVPLAELKDRPFLMVQLVASDIRTREVLNWKGVHVFHGFLSVSSQKLLIFLNLKGIAWLSHPIDLFKNENLDSWYLGINPRGLVPALVHDGVVHIESNDIILYLEKIFPEPVLMPPDLEKETTALLKKEGSMHPDIRALSFRFVFAPNTAPKSQDDLKRYDASSGTIGGRKDGVIAEQVEFWTRVREVGIRTARRALPR